MELLRASRGLSSLRRAAARQPAWICQSCLHRNTSARRWQSTSASLAWSQRTTPFTTPTSTDPVKPYYITTPIFYVNASPHIGHMYTMVLADVLKRWESLKNTRPTILCTGTDEHGMKIQRAALRADVAPAQFCDTNAATFVDLAARARIANDIFIRTTEPRHAAAVRHFWRLLVERGLIYEKQHEGWYSVGDEAFYPESMIESRVNPMTGKNFMAAVETGNEVEWTVEKNYHFRLTAMRERLLGFFKKNPEWVVPETRMAEVVDWVENHLTDLSVSRPANRLEWGIPVPDDPQQTVYVWVDALINYITAAGFPDWAAGTETEGGLSKGWPADVHVVGKDILRFHAVYWPALLMALDLPLPKRILSHAHWTLGGRKMSKSVGNVVNPFFALDRWGVDPLRYFLVYNGGIAYDSDYDNLHIVEHYKKALAGGLGNLLSRITRPKKWSVRVAVEAAENGTLPKWWDSTLEYQRIKQHRDIVAALRDAAEERMAELDAGKALRAIMAVVFETNRYVTDTAPWALVEKEDAQAELDLVVFVAAESLRIVGILLQPFMPEKAGELLDVLGVAPERRTYADAEIGVDLDYGTPMRSPGRGRLDGLFPPLEIET